MKYNGIIEDPDTPHDATGGDDLAHMSVVRIELTDDPDPDTLIDALLLAVDPMLGAPVEQVVRVWRTAIEQWTPEERKVAETWATAEQQRALEGGPALPRPSCVDRLPLLPTTPERTSSTWTRVVGHG